MGEVPVAVIEPAPSAGRRLQTNYYVADKTLGKH